jgi:hypothetical protein
MGTIVNSSGGAEFCTTDIICPVVNRENCISPQCGHTSAGTFRNTARPMFDRGSVIVTNFISHFSPQTEQTISVRMDRPSFLLPYNLMIIAAANLFYVLLSKKRTVDNTGFYK